MTPRLATPNDLPGLLRLYRFLHPDDPIIDPQDEALRRHWRGIVEDPRLRYHVIEHSGALAATCTLTLIPNLTRSLRPYGVIENVVTDPDRRMVGLLEETAIARAYLRAFDRQPGVGMEPSWPGIVAARKGGPEETSSA